MRAMRFVDDSDRLRFGHILGAIESLAEASTKDLSPDEIWPEGAPAMTALRHSATRRPLACLLALCVGLSGIPQAAQAQLQLPALGDVAGDDLSLGAERRLGEQIMRDIRRDPDYLDDPVLLEYVNSIWHPLVASARKRGDIDAGIEGQFALEAFLVRDRSVNAFALPGGFVGVHLGLMAMTSSAEELASVMAHELSHVSQRHIARSIGNAQRSSLLSLGALILGVLAASRANNPEVAQAAIVGGQAASLQGQLNFSRDMEREADRIGFGVLVAAGFNGAGMAAMFEKLDQANRLNDSGAFPYLRSHPLTVDRMSEARSKVLFAPSSNASTLLHTLMQARARVLMDGSVDWQRKLVAASAVSSSAPAVEQLFAHYSRALAANLLREPERARAALSEARRLVLSSADERSQAMRALDLLDVELRIRDGDFRGAIETLDHFPTRIGSRPVMLLRTQAIQGAFRSDPANQMAALKQNVEELQGWASLHPNDAEVWAALSSGAESLGMKLRALRAQAEQRAAVGDLTGAIDRLRVGRSMSRPGTAGADFVEASIIDARLRALEGQRRQWMSDARGDRTSRTDDDPGRH